MAGSLKGNPQSRLKAPSLRGAWPGRYPTGRLITEFRTPQPLWWEKLKAVSASTLLVGGGPSSHVSPDALARVCEIVGDCRLVTVEDAGHRVHSLKPEEFWSVTAPFLLTDNPGDGQADGLEEGGMTDG
ncbi:alpha/beta hydrolase [Streptosporangium sp. NPDC020145]|uniref:alpha/beta fold hydrolase n=1 Tax=Streptosporangium sp. NPDC020145 TaxID=3154694 RepID=UPI00341B0906